MKGELFEEIVVIKGDPKAQRLSQKGFGKLKDNTLELSLLEALFLLDRGTIEVLHNGKQLEREALIKKSGNEEDFLRRYNVYRDLRSKGYVVKTGFKFGVHFRVYEKSEFTEDAHSSFLVHAVSEDDTMSFPDLARAVRLTQSVKKKMMFAVVDHEGDVTYYMVDRVIP